MSSEEEERIFEEKGDFMVFLAKEIAEEKILLSKSQLSQKIVRVPLHIYSFKTK